MMTVHPSNGVISPVSLVRFGRNSAGARSLDITRYPLRYIQGIEAQVHLLAVCYTFTAPQVCQLFHCLKLPVLKRLCTIDAQTHGLAISMG